MFTNIVIINLLIALALEQFRMKDKVKLAEQRKAVLKAAKTKQVGSIRSY